MAERDNAKNAAGRRKFTESERSYLFRYPLIFWDDEEIRNMEPWEFMQLITSLRASSDPKDRRRFKGIIRRMIERGSCTEGRLYLLPEEIRTFFENETIYWMDRRVEFLWKKMASLPRDFQLKKYQGGGVQNRENS